MIGTDPIQGVLEDLTRRERRKHIDLRSLVRNLIELVDILKAKRLTHGDFQQSIISYRLCPDGKTVDYMGLIDFEASHINHGDDLRHRSGLTVEAVNAKLLRYFIEADFNFPEWFLKMDKSITGIALREYGSRLFKEGTKTSCKPIKMPTIFI